MFVAGRRIDAFMAKAEIDEKAINKIAASSYSKFKSDDINISMKSMLQRKREDYDVRVENASFSWTPESEGNCMERLRVKAVKSPEAFILFSNF